MDDTDIIHWKSHYIVKQANSSLNEGDKIILPATALEQLISEDHALPSPMTFELRHPHLNTTIHAGVKEFSSSHNDIAYLPLWMLNSLGIREGERILIQLKYLPKGTWAQLQPVSADHTEILDYRAAFEAHLRGNYTTLTKGQILTCRYGSRTYDFKVMELKPEEAVSITDTDLEVDITAGSQHMSTYKMKEVRLSETVDHSDIPCQKYRYWKLNLTEDIHNLSIHLIVESGNADIVISPTDKSPTLDNYVWGDLTSDNERIIQIENIATSVLYIGIHGYTENTIVTWKSEVGEERVHTEDNDRTGKLECPNCHAWILERTMMLHEGFCFRNNVLCPMGCGQVFKKGSDEFKHHWHCDQCDRVGHSIDEHNKHREYYHDLKSCDCGYYSTSSYSELAHHKRTECALKLIICRYCHILTAQGVPSTDARDRLLGLHSHESYCGSRTITCQKCTKPIPIKDIQIHAKIHEVKRQQQTLPPPCSNVNCIRPRAKNRLCLCQFCFGPFWITEDDPKNTKLLQRLARKLHSQLTVGCGNNWCRNQYCATSTGDPKDATTAASLLLPMIRPLTRELLQAHPRIELYLCVDESTTRKKFLAEMIYAENKGKYELGWCVKALEHEEEDMNRANTWLDRNAPRIV